MYCSTVPFAFTWAPPKLTERTRAAEPSGPVHVAVTRCSPSERSAGAPTRMVKEPSASATAVPSVRPSAMVARTSAPGAHPAPSTSTELPRTTGTVGISGLSGGAVMVVVPPASVVEVVGRSTVVDGPVVGAAVVLVDEVGRGGMVGVVG